MGNLIVDPIVEYLPWPQVLDEIASLNDNGSWSAIHYGENITIFSQNFKITIKTNNLIKE